MTNPVAIPARLQDLALIKSRMTDARRDLLAAVQDGQVRWHRPPGNSMSRTTWDRRVVTGEVNWLRSHDLATLGLVASNTKRDGTIRPVILTARGRELLDMLS